MAEGLLVQRLCVFSSASQPSGDRGVSRAKDPRGLCWLHGVSIVNKGKVLKTDVMQYNACESIKVFKSILSFFFLSRTVSRCTEKR